MKKKVLALALALVLVLGMTSAFALNCRYTSFDWTSTSTCYDGRGTVRIVPYVKVNSCDALGYVWQESSCASAINGENIYFAIELTVAPNPDQSSNSTQAAYWWDLAQIKFETKGLAALQQYDGGAWDVNGKTYTYAQGMFNGVKWDKDSEKVYYWNNETSTWVYKSDATEDTATLEDFIVKGVVTNASQAKVCATLSSYHNGITGPNACWSYGDYDVYVNVTKGTDGKIDGQIAFADGSNNVTLTIVDDKITATQASSESFFSKVISDFQLGSCSYGATMSAANIEKNFGWDDEQEACAKWGTAGTAVVDPNCVVEIPKTGDVSVIAYAVMALVAAAGAMGLKK